LGFYLLLNVSKAFFDRSESAGMGWLDSLGSRGRLENQKSLMGFMEKLQKLLNVMEKKAEL
jgi:hypothetical protein